MAMPGELARTNTSLGGPALAHVRRLIASWQVLADLCFSDLLFLAAVEGEEGHRFVVLTGPPEMGKTAIARMVSLALASDGWEVHDELWRPEEARRRWQTENRSRALFEREDSGQRGPRVLNRSFAGTYPDEE